MFKNYCKSYKYKIVKRNLNRCIKLNELDKTVTTQLRAQHLPTSTRTQPEVSEPSTSTTIQQPYDCLDINDSPIEENCDFDLDSMEITEDLTQLSDDFLINDNLISKHNSTPEKPEHNEVNSRDFLISWSLKNNITHTALSEILS